MEQKRYNEEFIELMDKLNNIMLKRGEPFRARAYQKAQETIMTYTNDIFTPNQLKDLPGVGVTILDKLNEFTQTGTLQIIENEKTNPINIFTDIYGVGPKKAAELVDAGIKTIAQLRENQQLLNDIQKIGLIHYEDILEKIPRNEIEEYKTVFESTFSKSSDDKIEIVGSYRRGSQSSGDIDVIITSTNPKIFSIFINELIKNKIILHVLSKGPTKCLVITKLFNKARRVDFLYTTPQEFPFAILYFTGSKIFNTVMRQYAVNKGYTFNEHGIYHLENKQKGEKVEKVFNTEKDIFDFLGLQYKTPLERQDGRMVIPFIDVGGNFEKKVNISPTQTAEDHSSKKNKTLKKRTTKPALINIQQFEGKTNILQIVEQFKHNGISVLGLLNEKQLTDIIQFANTKYYNQCPIMTDNQFDIIKQFIEHKYPNNVSITEIGAEVERNKVKLPYEMPSMDKIKPDTKSLSNWMNKFNGPYTLSCKLDGVSALYTTTETAPKLYTRGNGTVGQDISHLIPFLCLPKTKDIVIRGEIIIPKNVFEQKYKTTFANPRNMVAGIINHKHISNSIKDTRFVAYEVISPQLIPSMQMEFLKTIDVESVLSSFVKTLSNEILSELLVKLRDTYTYEIDGIIVTNDQIYQRKSGNPEHAFAFKMVLSDQIAEAKVVDVLWTPSKDGYLKPRIQIEPIILGGVKIEYATGFNAAFIKDNNIGIGTTIQLIRSGDVIPYIKSVIVPSEPKMPSVPYIWNETHIDIMIENASEDPIVKEKNITGFFKGIGVEGLSSGNISRLIKCGFSTVPQIIAMSESDFLKVDGFKDKMANKIYTGIRDKLKETTIIELMAASNIFGRGFSEKKMVLIINEFPNILVSNQTNNDKINAVITVKGMALKTAEALVNNIADFKHFLTDCGLEYKLYEKGTETTIEKNKEHPLFEKTIVLTGTRDKNIIEFLKNTGVKQGSTVNKNTFIVVAKNKDEDTGKAEEARKLNIPIMSVDQFIQTYIKK
jgi:NAD-dependent DNA ligase